MLSLHFIPHKPILCIAPYKLLQIGCGLLGSNSPKILELRLLQILPIFKKNSTSTNQYLSKLWFVRVSGANVLLLPWHFLPYKPIVCVDPYKSLHLGCGLLGPRTNSPKILELRLLQILAIFKKSLTSTNQYLSKLWFVRVSGANVLLLPLHLSPTN